MTLLINSFEGGTSGVNISTANSGGLSGNAFDGIVLGAGGTLQYSNAQSAHGSISMLSQTVAANSTGVSWTAQMGNQTQVWFQSYMFFPSLPTGITQFFSALISGTGTARFNITTSGQMQIAGTASTFTTGTAAIPTNQWFRVNGYAIGSTTAGAAQVNLFSPMDSLKPIESDVVTSVNTGGQFQSYAFGPNVATANQGPLYMDDLWLSSVGPFTYPPYSIPDMSLKRNQTVSRTTGRLNRM
jgi:hypothetical protein